MIVKSYRKKPVVINAVQLTEKNIKQAYEFVYGESVVFNSDICSDKWDDYKYGVLVNGMNIPTLEDGGDFRAKHVASIGDYIIKGVQGEFYPCKPDIFKLTYEVVE